MARVNTKYDWLKHSPKWSFTGHFVPLLRRFCFFDLSDNKFLMTSKSYKIALVLTPLINKSEELKLSGIHVLRVELLPNMYYIFHKTQNKKEVHLVNIILHPFVLTTLYSSSSLLIPTYFLLFKS